MQWDHTLLPNFFYSFKVNLKRLSLVITRLDIIEIQPKGKFQYLYRHKLDKNTHITRYLKK